MRSSTAKPLTIPSRSSMVLLTALAITAFISLPRLAVWRQMNVNSGREINWSDFLLRASFLFGISLLFFALNLQRRRLLLSLAVFVVLNRLLLYLHIMLFTPPAGLPIFKFLFNVNMVLAVAATLLFAEIFRLLYHNAETQYEVLKNQVNPHFLFNSLNTVNALIVSDQQAAVQFVNNMSDVFRYVLKSREVDMTTLEEELRFIEAYIEMLKGRHGNKLNAEIDVQSEYLHNRLPPVSLQILVENAVKHNIASNAKPLTIQIFCGNERELTIRNNLQKRKHTEPSTGLGLQNLNQRCKYLSNRDLVIQQNATHFSVTIPLI